MANKSGSEALRRFRDHVSELTETWYDGDTLGAFRHAAFQQIAPDPSLSDEQVIEMTAIDKSGDLEVDGWVVDDTSEEFVLFQAVGGKTRVDEASVAKFWMSPEEVLNPDRVAGTRNQSVRELSDALTSMLKEDYSLTLVFAARSGFESAAIKFSESKRGTERTLKVSDGSEVVCRCSLRLVDEKQLAARFDDYSAGFRGDSPNVRLRIRRDWQYVVQSGNAESVRVTVPAKEVVRVFKEAGYSLFKLNPRGPIANAKVNKRIAETLRSPERRKTFHLLNNGLCGTCDSFAFEDPDTLTAKNFQIVNGCQTTVTLADQESSVLDDTLVDLKLVVAGIGLAEEIASSSNSQTALKAKDYVSFERQQQHLEADFRSLLPPWYYEIKQGYWRFVLSDKEKARYKAGARKRHIEVQPMAQASLAFRGYPAEALDRVRFVFQGIRSQEEREWYERAFPTEVKAQQLILPWTMLNALAKRSPQLRFSNFHMLWMIAQFLRNHYETEAPSFFSVDLSIRLASSVDDWLPDAYRAADNACSVAFLRARSVLGGELELRDFFRASADLSPGLTPLEELSKRVCEKS